MESVSIARGSGGGGRLRLDIGLMRGDWSASGRAAALRWYAVAIEQKAYSTDGQHLDLHELRYSLLSQNE